MSAFYDQVRDEQILRATRSVVAKYVSQSCIRIDELASLIKTVHATFDECVPGYTKKPSEKK